jgi:hypothetical protein
MKMRMMVMTALALAAGAEARATGIPELTRYLDAEIAALDGAVDDAERGSGELRASSLDPKADQHWYLRQFWIRLRAPVGFEIPGIAKVTVIPETELLWERPNPEGWVSYKP